MGDDMDKEDILLYAVTAIAIICAVFDLFIWRP